MLLGVAAISAQEKANFAGNWTLDVSKSKLSDRMPIESMTMNVSQTDAEITVETKTVRGPRPEGAGGGMGGGGGMGRGGGMGGTMGGDATLKYTLDGKESVSGEAKIKAKFEKDGKMKLIQTRSFETPMGAMSIKTVETWQLLDEGKSLKVNRDTETPRGTQSTEMVFTKN